jgi:hypothetical protein
MVSYREPRCRFVVVDKVCSVKTKNLVRKFKEKLVVHCSEKDVRVFVEPLE